MPCSTALVRQALQLLPLRADTESWKISPLLFLLSTIPWFQEVSCEKIAPRYPCRGVGGRGRVRHGPRRRSNHAHRRPGCAWLFPAFAGWLPNIAGELSRQMGRTLLLPQGHDFGLHP